jgi:hypothetical protein
MQRLDDGRADIARADDEDLHPSGILTSAPAAGTHRDLAESEG